MDKQTIIQYSWILIVSMIIVALMVFATPMGEAFGQSVIKIVVNQTQQLGNVYSEENIEDQKNYMNQLFDATHMLDAGLYEKGNHATMVYNWKQLVDEGYIAQNSGTIIADIKASKINGDLIVDDLVFVISNNTFRNADKLNLVRLGVATQSVGNNAFESCDNLTTFISNATLKTIGASAFSGCKKLKNVYITDTVTSIGASAFAGCSELETITFYGTKEQWNAISKGSAWSPASLKHILCTDGNIDL